MLELKAFLLQPSTVMNACINPLDHVSRETRNRFHHDAADGIVIIHFQSFYASCTVLLHAFFMSPLHPNAGGC
jgi:hypothetical protein